ncbi:MAG: hypothetical protein ABI690_35810 [Chloroflexota bacterium]
MTTKQEALEELQRGKWQNDRVPEIITAAEAYNTHAPDRRFYTVAWWGDDERPLPAGFTRFDFEQIMGNEYVIMWRTEPRDRVGTILADELVLMFID